MWARKYSKCIRCGGIKYKHEGLGLCKKCYNRKWVIKFTNKNEKENRKFLQIFKANKGCQICGENHPTCLDFHHIDATEKSGGISTKCRHWSKARLEKEITKCIVLCSNCHRKIHHRD
jgi:hypothetical protein